MSSDSIATMALGSFTEFVMELPPVKLATKEETSLAGYIHAWVRSGHGVRACLADFQTYLTALPVIIDHWMRDPEVLDYVPSKPDGDYDKSGRIERRVDRVFPPSRDNSYRID